jgi:hypothetical protein
LDFIPGIAKSAVVDSRSTNESNSSAKNFHISPGIRRLFGTPFGTPENRALPLIMRS